MSRAADPRRRMLSAGAAAALMIALAPARAWARPLEALAWSARPVLVFAPGETAAFGAQRAALEAAAAALAEREMPVFLVAGEAVRRAGPALAPALTPTAADLRAAYAVAPGAAELLLIGKDTGVKLRAPLPVAPADLFALVDGMPMRRREMRARSPS